MSTTAFQLKALESSSDVTVYIRSNTYLIALQDIYLALLDEQAKKKASSDSVDVEKERKMLALESFIQTIDRGCQDTAKVSGQNFSTAACDLLANIITAAEQLSRDDSIQSTTSKNMRRLSFGVIKDVKQSQTQTNLANFTLQMKELLSLTRSQILSPKNM